MPSAPTAFEMANAITSYLLEDGWRYDTCVYCLNDMMSERAGNCLGLTCLYGAILGLKGFEPHYELVVGPRGFQFREEQKMLHCLVMGEVFPFDHPLLPLRPARGVKLLFATLGHPRLILDGQVFETTTMEVQHPSEITGESTRSLNENELLSLVLYERAHQAFVGAYPNYTMSRSLLNEVKKRDPHNREVYAKQAIIAQHFFEDDCFEQARNAYEEVVVNDSQYFLQRYCLFERKDDLERALQINPTNMLAWGFKNVLLETDRRTRRANCAVVAQCIARSEVLHLGDFYATYAAILADLFPQNVVSLIEAARTEKTNQFEHHLALIMLERYKKMRLKGKRGSDFHKTQLLMGVERYSPMQRARVAFALRDIPEHKWMWREIELTFEKSLIFQQTFTRAEKEWKS